MTGFLDRLLHADKPQPLDVDTAAAIPDEAPLCTTRSKNVRHVAHAVKSRVRTIMLDRRVYRVAMQAKGGR